MDRLQLRPDYRPIVLELTLGPELRRTSPFSVGASWLDVNSFALQLQDRHMYAVCQL